MNNRWYLKYNHSIYFTCTYAQKETFCLVSLLFIYSKWFLNFRFSLGVCQMNRSKNMKRFVRRHTHKHNGQSRRKKEIKHLTCKCFNRNLPPFAHYDWSQFSRVSYFCHFQQFNKSLWRRTESRQLKHDKLIMTRFIILRLKNKAI